MDNLSYSTYTLELHVSYRVLKSFVEKSGFSQEIRSIFPAALQAWLTESSPCPIIHGALYKGG